jgi:hypothetical protein
LDAVALADTAATKGINSKETATQAFFLGADWFTGRTGGTYVLQLAVAASDVSVDVLGDSAGLSEKYGPGLTFYQWCERNCPDR